MARLRIVFRSTAVRLSALYILLFALCAAFLVFYVTALSERLLNQQTRDAVLQEVSDVQRIYSRGGINPLLRMMERRARQPGASLYVIAGPNGEILAGNVASVQPGVFDRKAGRVFLSVTSVIPKAATASSTWQRPISSCWITGCAS